MQLVTIPAPVAKFPDRIAAPAPRGMRDDIRRAASLQGTTSASFIRDAITERVRDVLKAHQDG